MVLLTTTFNIPTQIAQGLSAGVLERVGGVVRDAATKQVVMWLRDTGTVSPSILPTLAPMLNPSTILSLPIAPVTGTLNLVASLANTSVSAKGFSDVKQQLGGVSQQLVGIEQNLQQAQGILHLTSAASMLSLGVSVIGFAVIAQRIKELETRLQLAQEVLNKLNHKVDLAFYANFRAALDLATNAFTMNKPENRRSSALSAINRFLEAEHIYLDYVDRELEQGSQIVDEYLLTLALAYISEARCYLELEEFDIVLRRLQEGQEKLRSRTQQYIELLLTSNPSAYLDPQFKGQINLSRLTKIFQWIDPALDENAVFELQRENLFNLRKEQSIESGYQWVKSLPSAIVAHTEVKGSIFGNREETKQEAIKRLPQAIEMMESLIETCKRFESYQIEVQAIAQLGISFHDWLKLIPEETQLEGENLICILPSEPLKLESMHLKK